MAEAGGYVLVVDDEPDICTLITEILSDEGYEVVAAGNADEARARRREQRPDAILLDVWMPDTDGITLLREWAEPDGLDAPVIVMSGHGTIETAVEATRLGAYDFLEKPISLAKLILTVQRTLEADRLTRENARLRRREDTGADLIGHSEPMNELRQHLQLAANGTSPILITGESGTGKALAARHLHAIGPRREGPFIEVPVAHLDGPADLFGAEDGDNIHYGPIERANHGTLLLEDIADLPPPMQAQLAGALQTGAFHRAGGSEPVRVSARIVTASRRDLVTMVHQGAFDESLYFLLNVVPVELVPLRERAEDIPALVEWFVDEIAAREQVPLRRFAVDAQNRLRNYPWPGNVRELRNVVQRLMILGQGTQDIHAGDVEAALGTVATGAMSTSDFDLPYRDARERFERAYLLHQLDRSGANMSEIATRTGVQRSQLYRKFKQLGIERRGTSSPSTPPPPPSAPTGGRFPA